MFVSSIGEMHKNSKRVRNLTPICSYTQVATKLVVVISVKNSLFEIRFYEILLCETRVHLKTYIISTQNVSLVVTLGYKQD